MKISVSSYSFHQYIARGEMTQLDAIAKAHELGFEAIEFTDLTPCENPTLTMPERAAMILSSPSFSTSLREEAVEITMSVEHSPITMWILPMTLYIWLTSASPS